MMFGPKYAVVITGGLPDLDGVMYNSVITFGTSILANHYMLWRWRRDFLNTRCDVVKRRSFTTINYSVISYRDGDDESRVTYRVVEIEDKDPEYSKTFSWWNYLKDLFDWRH